MDDILRRAMQTYTRAVLKDSKDALHYDAACDVVLAEIHALAGRTSRTPAALAKGFGLHLFAHLVDRYPEIVWHADTPEDFILSLNTVVLPVLRRMHPGLAMVSVSVEQAPGGVVKLTCAHSFDGVGDLVQGMVQGCYRHYGLGVTVDRETSAAGAVLLLQTMPPANDGEDLVKATGVRSA